jgi:hypothetical protein
VDAREEVNGSMIVRSSVKSMPVRCDGSTVIAYDQAPARPVIGDTLTQCDSFDIPSTSPWTDAAIIVPVERTKNCIVTGPRASRRPMPSSLAG